MRGELDAILLCNKDLKNRLKRFVIGSTRASLPRSDRPGVGCGRNRVSKRGTVLPPVCRLVVERSAPETQSLRRCTQFDLWHLSSDSGAGATSNGTSDGGRVRVDLRAADSLFAFILTPLDISVTWLAPPDFLNISLRR